MNKEKIIYLILLTAIFNAVLRPSPDSAITVFRLLMPLSLILIRQISKKVFNGLLISSFIFACISSIQYIITIKFLYSHVTTLSFLQIISYYIHYLSMFIVYSLVYCLMILQGDDFFTKMIRYASKVFKLVLLLYTLYILVGFTPKTFKLFGNINDFGCVLSGGLIVLLFDNSIKTKIKYVYFVLTVIVLLYNDSKLALFGGVFAVMLYYMYNISQRFPQFKKIVLFILIFGGVFSVYLFFMSEIVINGYPVKDLIQVPLNQISSGVYFPQSNESFTYRSNAIIGITEILRTSLGIGIGPGNTSLILKLLMPDPDGYLDPYSVSSHIWWYEIMADLGWLFIIPMFLCYKRRLSDYIKLNTSTAKLFSQVFILSFPLWCMSSSGLYTEFYSIMLISFSILLYKNKYFNSTPQCFPPPPQKKNK